MTFSSVTDFGFVSMANGIFMPYMEDLVISPTEVGIGETVTITFTAGNDILTGLKNASGSIMVNYEEKDDGGLDAVGVTF